MIKAPWHKDKIMSNLDVPYLGTTRTSQSVIYTNEQMTGRLDTKYKLQ